MKEFDWSLLIYMTAGAVLYNLIQETTGKKIRKKQMDKGIRLSFPSRYTSESPDVVIKEYLPELTEEGKKTANFLEAISKNRNAINEAMLPAGLALLGFIMAHYLNENVVAPKEHQQAEELKKAIKEHISAIWELKRWKSDTEKEAAFDPLLLPGEIITRLLNAFTGGKASFSSLHGAWLSIAIPIGFVMGRTFSSNLVKGQSETLSRLEEEGTASPSAISGGLAPFKRPAKTKHLAPTEPEKLKDETEKELTKKHKDKMTLEELFNQVK